MNPSLFPRAASWWDDLEVPRDVANAKPDILRDWLAENTPDPMEHDFILYTDGSGCTSGWGAYAAAYDEIIGDGENPRHAASHDVRIGATYGSTVQRCELTALLEGLHAILYRAIARTLANESDERLTGLSDLTGDRRVTVCWYTDRLNLARALLFDESGQPLDSRAKERDLWLRYSAFAKHVCITPNPMPRNVIGQQERMDKVCDIARHSLKAKCLEMAVAMNSTIDILQWTTPRPQKALF